MKTAKEILQKHYDRERMGYLDIEHNVIDGSVEPVLAAMEEYADQFKSSPIEAVEVVNPANQEWDDKLYLEAYETYGSELANLPPKVVRKEKSDQSDSELTNT